MKPLGLVHLGMYNIMPTCSNVQTYPCVILILSSWECDGALWVPRYALNTTHLSGEKSIKGTMDLAIVDVKNIITENISGGIRVGIELKKEVKNKGWPQVITELCTAKIYSKYPVIMVLTDPRDTWIFFWLHVDGFVVDCGFSDIRAGIVVLQDLVNHFDSAERTSTDKPYLQRCDFATVVGRGGRGAGRSWGD